MEFQNLVFGRGTARGWLVREGEMERRGKVEGVLRSRNGEGGIRPGRFGGRVGGVLASRKEDMDGGGGG